MGIFSGFSGQGISTLMIGWWGSSHSLLYFSQTAWACFRYNNADGVFVASGVCLSHTICFALSYSGFQIGTLFTDIIRRNNPLGII